MIRWVRVGGMVGCLVLAASLGIAVIGNAHGSVAHAPVSGLLVVATPSAVSVIKTIKVGTNPSGEAFDSANGEIFIADSESDSVSVISGSSNSVITTIKVGTDPSTVVFDASNGKLYVLNFDVGTVSIVMGSTNKVIKTVPVDPLGVGPFIDPKNGFLYVGSSSGSVSSVSAINPTTNAVTSLAVGSAPDFMVYDPATTDMVVSDSAGSALSLISPTNSVATVSLGNVAGPEGSIYNPADSSVYVADSGLFFGMHGNISVLGPTNTIVAKIPVAGNPILPTLDPTNHDVYVVGEVHAHGVFAPSKVSVISTANKVVATITVGKGAFFSMFDPANKDLYSPSPPSNTTAVISGSTNTVIKTLSTKGPGVLALFDAANSDIYVIGASSPSTPAVVTVFSSSNALVATLTLGMGAGGAVFDTSNSDWYFANPGSNVVSVVS